VLQQVMNPMIDKTLGTRATGRTLQAGPLLDDDDKQCCPLLTLAGAAFLAGAFSAACRQEQAPQTSVVKDFA
jgi:hypothetical protein